MCATFVNSLESSGRENESDSFFEFRHINTFFLEIGIFANEPGRIKLGCASAV